MKTLRQISKVTGEILRQKRGVTPVIEIHLDSHQHVISSVLQLQRESVYSERKTVDWEYTVYVATNCGLAAADLDRAYVSHQVPFDGAVTVNAYRLDEARWAATNTKYRIDGKVPSIEWATELADKIVCSYLGLLPEEWQEQVDSAYGE